MPRYRGYVEGGYIGSLPYGLRLDSAPGPEYSHGQLQSEQARSVTSCAVSRNSGALLARGYIWPPLHYRLRLWDAAVIALGFRLTSMYRRPRIPWSQLSRDS